MCVAKTENFFATGLSLFLDVRPRNFFPEQDAVYLKD